MRTLRSLTPHLLVASVLGLPILLAQCSREVAVTSRSGGYVGRSSCAECHEQASKLCEGSHHDLAMQVVNAKTMLGDFNDAKLTHFGVTSRFETEGANGSERYFVLTEGLEKDKLERFEIAYIFGFYPLQQYLVAFPDGRYQVLPLCWDSRSKEQGGQRWFHLYQDERITPDDPLYWMGPQQNWNYMCAECHSTNLQRNYDKEKDRFETTWSEIDVSCETCHGPAGKHVAWAKADKEGDPRLSVDLSLNRDGFWKFDEDARTARFEPARKTRRQLESCAPCHSRRYDLVHTKKAGVAYDDQYHLSLLREGLYYPDGQILDEVYVYGSFLQSKMHAAQVTCSDCHDPHSLQVKAKGNALCSQCHKPDFYDNESHHHHKPATQGSACVDCHMPTKDYMVVDPRLDHSIRVPRPDLSLRLGTPNACNGCHKDKGPQWAQESVVKWYGTERSRKGHYGMALSAGQRGDVHADDALIRLAEDVSQPIIARATGASLLAGYPGPKRDATLAKLLNSQDPLLRRAAIDGLESALPQTRLRLLPPMLTDPILDVRLTAYLSLSQMTAEQVPGGKLPKKIAEKMTLVHADYMAFFENRADRADAWFGLANLHLSQGRLTEAERGFKKALERDSTFALARANLADLYRRTGREMDCDQLLREGLTTRADTAPLYHALGLSLIRRKDYKGAVQPLGEAARMRPDLPRFVYAYALALQETGAPDKAIQALEAARKRFPSHPQILIGLVSAHEALGNRSQALGLAQELVQLYPKNQSYRQQVQRLQAGK